MIVRQASSRGNENGLGESRDLVQNVDILFSGQPTRPRTVTADSVMKMSQYVGHFGGSLGVFYCSPGFVCSSTSLCAYPLLPSPYPPKKQNTTKQKQKTNKQKTKTNKKQKKHTHTHNQFLTLRENKQTRKTRCTLQTTNIYLTSYYEAQ